jgi:hypothetical protein
VEYVGYGLVNLPDVVEECDAFDAGAGAVVEPCRVAHQK